MEIFTHPRFDRKYKKLPQEIKKQAKHKETFFRVNAFDSLLRTHKLHGKDRGLWVFWINNKYRIKFVFLDAQQVLFLDVGTHDIYS
ncbi:MAG: Plasmid stabilization system [Parcubacteria group bacterium GW2011_GWA2_47_12]|nr:MAG: Plasmid stabilization system [Parcubacteria group bacterium GW2011_GWA2_47_12]